MQIFALLFFFVSSTILFGAQVKLGNEVLAEHHFKELQGKRVGLITNPSGVNRNLESTIDVLRSAPGVKLVTLFGPEHGIYGDVFAGEKIANRTDVRTGLPVRSLYGDTRRPSAEMLEGLDAIVYDLQDTGCRGYTFISTMGVAMEACAETGPTLRRQIGVRIASFVSGAGIYGLCLLALRLMRPAVADATPPESGPVAKVIDISERDRSSAG